MAGALTPTTFVMFTIPSTHKQWSRASFKIKGEEEHFCSDSLKIEMASMIFLLLQNHWMNSWRDSPFFWMALARFQSTLECVHVAQKLPVSSQHKWFQERADPVGSLRIHVLADDDKQTDR
jgi:hypothetical protein